MKKHHYLLIAILALSTAVKLYLAWISRGNELIGDEIEYWVKAGLIAEGRNLDEVFRPPGYIYTLAALVRILGRRIVLAYFFQALLSTASTYLLYRLTTSLFDTRVALVAAGLFAFYPTLVGFTHYVMNETLFIFLLIALLYLLVKLTRSQKSKHLILIGAVLGTASLVKPLLLYFSPFIVLYLCLANRAHTKASLGQAALLLMVTLAVILPWMLRNYSIVGRSFLIDATAGANLLMGNCPLPPPNWDHGGNHGEGTLMEILIVQHKSFDKYYNNFHDEWYQEELDVALDFIMANPLLFLRRSVDKASLLWSPNSFVIKHARGGTFGHPYGNVSLSAVRLVTVATAFSYVSVMILGIAGILATRWTPFKVLLLSLIAYYTLLHAAVFACSRFRLPLMPFIMIYAAFTLCNPKAVIKESLKLRRALPALAILGALGISWWQYAPIIFDIF